MQVHYFDEAGIYTHSGELPTNPVTGKPFDHNPAVCTPDPLPEYDPEAQLARWDGSAWAAELIPAPEPTPEPEPEPIEDPPPVRCTRRQGRLALLAHGYLDDVEAAIDAITDPTEQRAARIEYEADTWERSNPVVQQMWQRLGGTPEQLDDLFRLAVTL